MDKRHIRSQAGIEFIILVGFLLFMLIVILGVVTDRTTDLHKKRDIIRGEDLVTKVQKEINLAVRVEDGYSRNFTLPQKLGTKDYDVMIVENEVLVRTDEQDFWRIIPNLTGDIRKGTNTINKTNGTIYLN